MSAWMCPACHEKLDQDGVIAMSFDLRSQDPPPPGHCWGCGARRLQAVADEPLADESVASSVASSGPVEPGR